MAWINVKDRLPEDSEHVLFVWSGVVEKGYWSSEDGWWWAADFADGHVCEGVEKWMPLPSVVSGYRQQWLSADPDDEPATSIAA